MKDENRKKSELIRELKSLRRRNKKLEIIETKRKQAEHVDLTERKRAEARIAYQAHLLANVKDAIVASDEQYRLTAWNAAAEALYGWKAEEVLGRNGIEIVRTEFPGVDSDTMRRRISETGYWQGEVTQARRDGTRIPVELASMVLRDETGRITGYVSVNRDITERKLGEIEINRQREILQKVFDHIPVMITYFDEIGNIKMVNQELVRKLGWTFEEWKTENILSKNYPEPEAFKETLDFMISKPGGWKDFKTTTKYGTVIDTTWTNISLPDGVSIGIGQDITERKRAEEALRLEKENFRHSLDESPLGVRIVTVDGDTLYANRAILDFYGYDSLEELRKTPLRARYAPESYAEFQKRKQQRERGDFSTSEYEISIVRKNGEVLHLQVHRKEVLWNNAKQFLVMYQDITERKQVQEQITMLAHAVRSINECVCITDTNNNIVFVNRAFFDTYGYTEQELLGKNINLVRSSKISDEDGERIRLSTLEGMWHGELMNKRKDGSEFPIFLSTTMVRDNKGEPIALIGVATDITERKQTEEEKLKLLRILETSLNEIYIFDISTFKFSYVNDAARHNIGYTFEEIKELTPLDLNPEFTDNTFRERVAPLLRGENVVLVFQTIHRRKDRSLYPIEVHLQIVKSGEEKVFLAIIIDITERKQIEETLQRERVFAESLIETAQTIVLVLDTQGRIVRFNPYMEEISGYALAEVQGKDWCTTFLPVRDRERTHNLFLKAIGNIQTRGNVIPIVTKDGREREIEWCDKTLKDEHGNVIGLLSIGQDITERKKVEEELIKSHNELRMLANHLQNIREEERNHLAREFHDQLGQSMTALKMDMSLLLRTISDEKQDIQRKLIVEELQSMQKLVDEASQLLWAIITELRPQMLDDLGLVTTFEWEAKRFESRTGISCEFKSSEKEIILDPKYSIALFRIYQEALTNVAQHANATVIKSVLRMENEMLVLEIKDNGCGISIDKKSKPDSFGLIGMRERVIALDGMIEISGNAGEGTTVKVRLPLEQVDAQENTSK